MAGLAFHMTLVGEGDAAPFREAVAGGAFEIVMVLGQLAAVAVGAGAEGGVGEEAALPV